jgi:hypothetical protein
MVNPHARARLREALDALFDDELHDRIWVHGNRADDREQDFEDVVLLIIDELEIGGPGELMGYVLVDEAELRTFARLSQALEELVAVIGNPWTYQDAVRSGLPWQAVLEAARSLRCQLDE